MRGNEARADDAHFLFNLHHARQFPGLPAAPVYLGAAPKYLGADLKLVPYASRTIPIIKVFNDNKSMISSQ